MSLDVKFSELVGKTLLSVQGTIGGESLIFVVSDGTEYTMNHSQDCCESVSIEDICGDLGDLLGAPILYAEEAESDKHPDGFTPEFPPDSFTWTFYRLGTIKGSVVIRWYGTSNGYYSESVSFERTR